MATSTTVWGMRKPATTDNVSVTTDLNANWDIVDARLATGYPRSGMSNITATRVLGILNHTGAPVSADGTFAVGDVVLDSAAQEWVCSVAGSPGTWLAVGSGKILGSARISTTFTMTTAATPEDVPSLTCNFTYDGRPVAFVLTPALTSQDQAAAKLITIRIERTSDNAIQYSSVRQTDATANSVAQQAVNTGPLTAWPSDSAAFVVGTTYGVKVNLTSGSSSKASIGATTTPCTLYVVTT